MVHSFEGRKERKLWSTIKWLKKSLRKDVSENHEYSDEEENELDAADKRQERREERLWEFRQLQHDVFAHRIAITQEVSQERENPPTADETHHMAEPNQQGSPIGTGSTCHSATQSVSQSDLDRLSYDDSETEIDSTIDTSVMDSRDKVTETSRNAKPAEPHQDTERLIISPRAVLLARSKTIALEQHSIPIPRRHTAIEPLFFNGLPMLSIPIPSPIVAQPLRAAQRCGHSMSTNNPSAKVSQAY